MLESDRLFHEERCREDDTDSNSWARNPWWLGSLLRYSSRILFYFYSCSLVLSTFFRKPHSVCSRVRSWRNEEFNTMLQELFAGTHDIQSLFNASCWHCSLP